MPGMLPRPWESALSASADCNDSMSLRVTKATWTDAGKRTRSCRKASRCPVKDSLSRNGMRTAVTSAA
eukprot:14098036-Alexandrium_andersonii.AAC.1